MAQADDFAYGARAAAAVPPWLCATCDERMARVVSQVRALSVSGKAVKVIACGGDGTVMWVASMLIRGGCNMDNVHIGVMPFGPRKTTVHC